MHTSTRFLTSIAFAACAYAESRILATDLSFGHEGRISNNPRQLPNFALIGEPSPPILMSNKVILTPPAPGNMRGALWGANTLQHSAWEADVGFRATGPERGGGKLAIWLVKDGQQVVGTSSIYTVGKFDGLALVIDTYARTAGMVRGFLNDGKTDFKSHHSVDSLAFGHCNYAYRNLGRPSQIKIKQSRTDFRLEVDGNVCFESDKIRLPVNYTWGITAVSGELPDTFEAYKMVVTTENLDGNPGAASPNEGQKVIPLSFLDNSQSTKGANPDPPEVSANKIKQEQQFADLHDRLQVIMKHIAALQHDYDQGRQAIEKQLGDVQSRVSSIPIGSYATSGDVKAVDKRLEAMEAQIGHIKVAVADKGHIEDLKQVVKETHSSLLEALPRYSFLVIAFLGSQTLLAAAYIIYKRQRANSPKKYL